MSTPSKQNKEIRRRIARGQTHQEVADGMGVSLRDIEWAIAHSRAVGADKGNAAKAAAGSIRPPHVIGESPELVWYASCDQAYLAAVEGIDDDG